MITLEGVLNIYVHRVGTKGGAQLVMKKVVEVLNELKAEFDLHITCSLDGVEKCDLCDETLEYKQFLPSSIGELVSNLILQKKLSNKRFDIIITHTLLPPNILKNTKFSIAFSGRDWSKFIKTRNLIGKFIEYAPQKTREIQCKNSIVFLINPKNKEYYLKLHPRKIFFVPNGVDNKLISSTPTLPKVYDFGFMGRFSPEKNPDLLINTFRDTQFRGLMIGATQDKVVGNIEIKKYMDHRKALEEISKVKIGIVPSIHEAAPLVVLEFLSLGIPVIVSDSIDAPYVKYCEKFKCCDREDLLSTFIRIYMNYPVYHKKYRHVMRRVMKEYNWNLNLTRYLKIILQTLK